MGRKKSYDRELLIAKALEVFRDRGFAGTSAEALCEALEVNRFSIYAEFGNKQALFNAVLQRYDDEAVQRNFGPLERPGAGFVKRYFKRLSTAFEAAPTNAVRSGDLRETVDPRREAGFLTSSVLGMFVMLRAKAPTSLIKGAAQSAIHYIDTLRAVPAK